MEGPRWRPGWIVSSALCLDPTRRPLCRGGPHRRLRQPLWCTPRPCRRGRCNRPGWIRSDRTSQRRHHRRTGSGVRSPGKPASRVRATRVRGPRSRTPQASGAGRRGKYPQLPFVRNLSRIRVWTTGVPVPSGSLDCSQHQEPPDRSTRQRILNVEPSLRKRPRPSDEAARIAGVGNDGPLWCSRH